VVPQPERLLGSRRHSHSSHPSELDGRCPTRRCSGLGAATRRVARAILSACGFTPVSLDPLCGHATETH
jgi:hypothetical protein